LKHLLPNVTHTYIKNRLAINAPLVHAPRLARKNNAMKNRLAFMVVAVVGFASGTLPARQDAPYSTGSQKLTVSFENHRVRVLELRLKPGEGEGFHPHPQYLLHALTNYRVRSTAADGTSKIFERNAGDLFWGEPIKHKGNSGLHANEVHHNPQLSMNGLNVQRVLRGHTPVMW
jgi:hypothetical protein